VVIPTYNNGGTIGRVVEETLAECDDVIVVNDGSTDATASILSGFKGITLVTLTKNSGKGAALKAGFRKAMDMGFAYAITLDGDGQHYPDDITLFLKANQDYPGALIMGSRDLKGVDRSAGSSFANKFSNFWFYVQTGRRLEDTQTGYRLYPLKKLHGLSLLTSRYEAELELIVFASWHGVKLVSIPVRVYYPPREERVSHFRPKVDFARISVLNTVLCILAVLYGLPLRLFRFLARLFRTVYSLLFFIFFIWFIITPIVWLYIKIGKMTEKKRQNIHQIIYKASRMVMLQHGIPGVRFSYQMSDEQAFSRPAVVISNHQSHLDLMCKLIFTPTLYS
jgi:glycosyltransferase involved in cell wall biosynthesis